LPQHAHRALDRRRGCAPKRRHIAAHWSSGQVEAPRGGVGSPG
jgi:hypothetical protein